MKIEMIFQGLTKSVPVLFDHTSEPYIYREGSRYDILGFCSSGNVQDANYEPEISTHDFLKNPNMVVDMFLIYRKNKTLLGYSPKIEGVSHTPEEVKPQPLPQQEKENETKKIGKLTAQVLFILEKMPDTRNDDVLLTTEVWKEFYSEKLLDFESGQAVMLSQLFQLPREDHIKRIRAKIQNDEKKFLPTSWAVAKKRQIAQGVWELAMQEMTNKIVNP